jgi:Cysteine rich domain with multizinc binding regions
VDIGMPFSPVSFRYWLTESKPRLPSENLLATDAPTTTKCNMCQVYFCGIGVQHRCVAVRLASAHPHGMSDISDLIQSTEVYECFDGNAVEVEIMLDYLVTQHILPRHIYGQVSVSPLAPEIYAHFLTSH